MKHASLEQFIKEKLDRYIEPQRAGTPKGDPIGFSKVKYRATLLMLQDRLQEDMARELGISYGLLRRWNTEKDFREQVEKHRDEYADKYDENRPKNIDELYEHFKKSSLDYDHMASDNRFNLITGIEQQLFHPKVVEKIFDPLCLRALVAKDTLLGIITYDFGLTVLEKQGGHLPKNLSEKIMENMEKVKEILIRNLDEIMEKMDVQKHTVEDKKLAKIILLLLARRVR